MKMKFHTQTAGQSLTAQQPMNNIVRTTIQALAGVLGGTQSLHTNSYDEALALPSEKAVRVALRTQQIIAEESGAGDVVDPLGGSYFVESLTDEIEDDAMQLIDHVDSMGDGSILNGVLTGIREGWFQREIRESAFTYQKQVESGEQSIVGVNKYTGHGQDSDDELDVLHVDEQQAEEVQRGRLESLRSERDGESVDEALSDLEKAVRDGENCMDYLVRAAKNYATMGEMMDVFRDVFGTYRE